MKKRIGVVSLFCVLLAAMIGLTVALPAIASNGEKQLSAVYRDIKINVDGTTISPADVNGSPTEPFIVDGTVYVPVRSLSEALGADVTWDDETSTVNIAPRSPALPPLPQLPTAPDAPAAPSRNVEVSSAAELVAAIAPDTCITLKAGLYDLSTVVGTESPYITWEPDFYGHGESTLVIHDIEGLTLEAAPGAEVEIVTPWKFAKVLSFSSCNGVTLKGIKAGHSVTGDYECDAGVVYFRDSFNISIDDCYFYGCGTVGIEMYDCAAAHVTNTTVTDCSLSGVRLHYSADINFVNCKIIDNRAYLYVIWVDNSTATFTTCEISGNKQLRSSVINVSGECSFLGCAISDNALAGDGPYMYPVIFGNGISLTACVVERSNFRWHHNGITDHGWNSYN